MQPERTIGFEIRSLNNMIKRDVERSGVFEICRATGLHGWAIGYFYDNRERDIFQRDFEEHFSIRRSTASNMLRLMEQNGLIRRTSVESDARLKKIELTEQAIALHERITADIADRERRLSAGITPDELNEFYKVIEKIKANLEVKND
mgnify:CR=1 FL=1